MRILLPVLLFFGLVSATPIPPAVAAPFNTAPIVQLVCEKALGTAVKVGDDKYVTAAHVVAGTGLCTIGGVPIRDVQISSSQDYAEFRGPFAKIRAKFRCRPFHSGEEYLAMGYAMGAPFITFSPWTASHFQIEDKQVFTGEAIPGMSGGAVIDQDGRVIGIVNQRWPARSLPLKQTPLCKD